MLSRPAFSSHERGRLVGYGQLDVIAGAVSIGFATCPDHRDHRDLASCVPTAS